MCRVVELVAALVEGLGPMSSNKLPKHGIAGVSGELIHATGQSATQPAIEVGNSNTETNVLPALLHTGGAAAQFAWEEFIYARVRNPHTRSAYEHAVRQFMRHCELIGKELPTISPRDVASYLDQLDYSPATKKLHLAGLRHFFDTLVTRHVVVLNPALSVRGDRLEVVEGKTPEITVQQTRQLFQSIDASTVVGLRDRAILGILKYTIVRRGAIARLRRGDFYDIGDQYGLRFTEKGGKSREIPVRHDLQQFIAEYIAAAKLEYSDKSTPLFRSVIRRTKQLTMNAMTPGDIGRMVKRRLKDAGLPSILSPHSFRAGTITDLLSQGVPLEDVQNLAGHADPRTTRLYDRRQRKVTRNIVERISS